MDLPTPPASPLFALRACRVDQTTPLDPILDLGAVRLSDFPLLNDPPPPLAPLILARCPRCNLVQLQHTVDPDVLFKARYWYRSSVNEVMQAELADIVMEAVSRVAFQISDVVIDIGANDGCLLQYYRRHPETARTLRVAYEPATNLHAALKESAEVVVPTYFTEHAMLRGTLAGRAKVITAIAMIYAVDDLPGFFSGVAEVLHDDGIFVAQFQDLWQMLRTTAFDNICHEHLYYFSLKSFQTLARACGLEVVDVQRRAINGGSLRLTLQHAKAAQRHTHLEAAARIAAHLEEEIGCDRGWTLEHFAWRVSEAKTQIQTVIMALHQRGATVDLYAASTKANTLLQVCQLRPPLLRQAWERSPEKIGRQTVTGIPIVTEAEGRADPPAALLLGAWQFKDAFLQREALYLENGGHIIVPLPAVEIVTAERHFSRRAIAGTT